MFFAYVIVSPTNVHIFIDPRKIEDKSRKNLTAELKNIEFHSYDCVAEKLEELVSDFQFNF